MPSSGAIDCRVSNSNDLNGLVLRFPDGSERTLRHSVASRRRMLRDMMDEVESVGFFTFADTQGHLAWWLEFIDALPSAPGMYRIFGALTPMKLVNYLRVC